MGTKIQSNAFLRDHCPVIYLEGRTSENGERPLYHKNGNGQNPGLFVSPVHKNGPDMDKIRNTILEQESMFRLQLQELHHLYRRQRELMNEIQRKETDKNGPKEDKTQTSFVFIPPKDGNGSWFSSFAPSSSNIEVRPSNINVPLKGNFDLESVAAKGKLFTSDVPKTSQCKDDALGHNLFQFNKAEDRGVNRDQTNGFTVSKDLFRSSFNSGKELLSDDHADKRIFGEHSSTRGVFSGKSMIFPREPRTELFRSPIFETGSSSWTKRKIFGVEIFEGNGDAPSNITRSLDQNLGHCNERSDSSLVPKHHAPAEGGLPWFLRDSQHKSDPSNVTKNSYFMNLDSLQNSSPSFFKKAEVSDSMQTSKQRIKISTSINELNDSDKAKKILSTPISDARQSFKDLGSAENPSKTKDGVSGSRQYIDLNLSLDEQNDLSPPCFPTATTEINLEASSAITGYSDANAYSKEGKSRNEEGNDKTAVDALIAISSYLEENLKTVIKDNDAGEPLESRLKWFADIVSMFCDDKEEESIPKGMDYFEYMTLNLDDAKDKNYLYNPTLSSLALHNKPNDGEIDDNNITLLTKRSRRRGSRQQRKDFQRDVLPGLVTLSRLQVTEDLQAFEQLNKAEGISRLTQSRFSRKKNCTRNSKVRKAVSSVRTQRIDGDRGEEGPLRRSLTSWGKRTRRLPRQRCFDGILSFAVKC